MKVKTATFEKVDTKILTLPNILSFLRICMIPFIVWFYCVKEEFGIAGCILILSGITDVVDGFIARHFNMVSDFGKALDPIADKLTQGVMLICLIFRFPLMIVPLIVLSLKESFMIVTNFLVIQKTGVVPGANWHGKVATALLYSMMILHTFWFEIPKHVSNILIYACAVMIALSFLLYGKKNINTLERKNDNEEKD